MATSPQFAPRYGTQFVDFARRAVEILLSNHWGVDQDIFLHEYYNGNPPTDAPTRDLEWEEFKRARDYSNQMFNQRASGWVWIRARRGLIRGQFFYQAVAQITDGEPEIVIRYPISQALYEEKTAEWFTRTKSQMRVKVANIEAKKRTALASGNTPLLREAERELDEIYVLAPRLAAIYFDTGLTVEDLQQLARSPRVPRMLLNSVKRTLDAYRRFQHEIQELSRTVYALKQISGGRP
jgi:hypothetical protein